MCLFVISVCNKYDFGGENVAAAHQVGLFEKGGSMEPFEPPGSAPV